jgi:diguanylate cyclase (GGDEF)-like protein
MKTSKISWAILNAFPVASFVIDAEGRVTHWNRACATLTSMPSELMLGTNQHWQAFYPNERMVMADLMLRDGHEQHVDHLYGGKCWPSSTIPGTYEAEDFFPHLGEGGRWLYFTAAPLHDDAGRLVGAIETLQDVTARRRAEEALQRSEEHFKTLSRTDPLTKLANFRDFYEQLENEIERAVRYGGPLSLAFIDIDDFKNVNDSRGHVGGDRVLQQLGGLIQGWKRRTDLAFRYGGDELAVLMPGAGMKQALAAAERLIRHLARVCDDAARADDTPPYTLSIGVAQYLPGETATGLVQRTDAATYQAKRQGKNQAVGGVAEAPLTSDAPA